MIVFGAFLLRVVEEEEEEEEDAIFGLSNCARGLEVLGEIK